MGKLINSVNSSNGFLQASIFGSFDEQKIAESPRPLSPIDYSKKGLIRKDFTDALIRSAKEGNRRIVEGLCSQKPWQFLRLPIKKLVAGGEIKDEAIQVLLQNLLNRLQSRIPARGYIPKEPGKSTHQPLSTAQKGTLKAASFTTRKLLYADSFQRMMQAAKQGDLNAVNESLEKTGHSRFYPVKRMKEALQSGDITNLQVVQRIQGFLNERKGLR